MSVADFKKKLAARETASLVNIDYPSAALANFVCGQGADALMIDCEQGNPGFQDVEHLTMAARLNGAASIVRVPSAEPWTIERYVMRDIDGVVVPRLDTAAQVERAVRDIEYASPKTFARKAVIIQVESAGAVRELDDFLAVPGIDCFFIGAVDLSKSMGFAGDYSAPEVMETLGATIARIRERGKSVGFLVSERDVDSWRERGVNMLYTHVNDFIRVGMRGWNGMIGLKTGESPS